MEANKNDDVIRLGDIFRVLWKNIILIAIITVAVFVVGIIYTFGIANPQYSSEQSFVVAVRDNSTGDITTGTPSTTVINTVSGLVTVTNVLEPVATANNLSLNALRDMVTVTSATNNGIISITVECGDPDQAEKLANAIFASLEDYLERTSISDYYGCAVVEASPASQAVYTSPNKVLYLAIFLIGGLVVGCIVAYVKEFCSSKFRTRDDIESYLDEKVIGYFIDDKSKDRNVSKAENERRSVELVKPSVRNYEPYNKLFTNIKYSDVDNPYRVIMFTSSQEKELKAFLDGEGIVIQAWYPLGHGDKALLEEPLFAELGRKYGKSSAQIILRWHMQDGNIVIPGSKNPDHIRANFDLFDFALTDEEMEKIAAMDQKKRYYTSTPEMLKRYAEMVPPVDDQK